MRIRNLCLAAASALALVTLVSTPSEAARCRPGWVTTVDDKCMPRGADDCGYGHGFCKPGSRCVRNSSGKATGKCVRR